MSTTMILSERLFSSSFIALVNFTNVSSDTTLLEGQDQQLFCIASGRPDPNIIWVRISPSGIVSDVLHRGTIWDFKNINRTEAGTYHCSKTKFTTFHKRYHVTLLACILLPA